MGSTAAIMFPFTALVPLRYECGRELFISYLSTIGRVLAVERPRHRQRLRPATLHGNTPQKKVRLLRRAGARRSEDHSAAIGRPPANAVSARMIGQPGWITAGSRDHVHIGIARDGAGEGDAGTIG